MIYYYHPESNQNLEEPARRNHSIIDTHFVGVSSFEELAEAVNNVPPGTIDVYFYMHSDAENFSFYYAQYYSATDIQEAIDEIYIWRNLLVFLRGRARRSGFYISS